jgi:hypothetical protein
MSQARITWLSLKKKIVKKKREEEERNQEL